MKSTSFKRWLLIKRKQNLIKNKNLKKKCFIIKLFNILKQIY